MRKLHRKAEEFDPLLFDFTRIAEILEQQDPVVEQFDMRRVFLRVPEPAPRLPGT